MDVSTGGLKQTSTSASVQKDIKNVSLQTSDAKIPE
jgi:hypothetical protein